jgi:hypothetical protein
MYVCRLTECFSQGGGYSEIIFVTLPFELCPYSPRARADAAVRESTTRPGRYTLDRGDEERTVPGMSWACGGCRRLMRRDVDTPKRCAGCSAVHYCGTGRVCLLPYNHYLLFSSPLSYVFLSEKSCALTSPLALFRPSFSSFTQHN